MHPTMLKSMALAAAAALPALAAPHCQNITVSVSISSAQNTRFELPVPKTDVDATNFVLAGLQAARSPPVQQQQQQQQQQSTPAAPTNTTALKDYDLAVTYCEPESGPSRVLQVLTHGIGFDRTYWDFPYNNYNYSYVHYAVEHGYSTLAWDRLGLGMSSLGEPLNEIQLPLEVEALKALTTLARGGEISEIGVGFDKVVHLGHSLGSSVTYALTALNPDISDGIVLTGWTSVSDFQPLGTVGLHLVQAKPRPGFEKYCEGYLVQGDVVALHTDFFAPGSFDPAILNAAYAAAQPVTVGEILTGGYMATSLNNATAAVLVITGERDLIFCGTDCRAVGDRDVESLLDVSRPFFPQTSSFNTTVVPGAGHGLNLDYTWPTTYGMIIDFLAQKGLAAA